MLVTACEEAALALSNDGLVDREDLEALTRFIAGLWNPTLEDNA